MRPRIAVVGAGIAGLGAAHALRGQAAVTLFEARAQAGGHALTVDVSLDGIVHGVDVGFLVFNHRTYPLLTRLFAELGVPTAPADMSLSVQLGGLEWSGSNLNAVFAQRRNLLRPRFWAMLRDIVRFNRVATVLAASGTEAVDELSVGDFLAAHRFGKEFREGYFLPMIASIWSCPAEQMLSFPLAGLLAFCHQHGLLSLNDRPQWFSVRGGSRCYVQRVLDGLPDVRLATPVRRIRRAAAGVELSTDRGSAHFDEVVLACHSDQALALLADTRNDERALLGAIRYRPNRLLLHTDASLLPRRRRAWAAWNCERGTGPGIERDGVCLHYLINKLQPLPWRRPVIVSMNPLRPPDPRQVLQRFELAHPVFDHDALAAQRRLAALQGRGGVWFCGAWAGHGFHEDGLRSGLEVADALIARWGRRAVA
jgi:predicted NAD/FAD-binding protein